MSWLDGLKHQLRAVFDPGAHERELQDEMRFHVELDAMQQRDDSRARRRFGNRTYHQEETRRMTWLGSFDVLQQDARYACRSLARTPGFALLVVGTFALGIGVNAATFTLLDRLYIRAPAGVVNPSEVHRVWSQVFRTEGGVPSWSVATTYSGAIALREEWGDPDRVVIHRSITDYRLGGTRSGPQVDAMFATANYFSVLGVRPALGRFYTADEDRLGHGAPVVVLSHHLWRAQFDGDSAILNKTIQLDAEKYTVIGVAPPRFVGIDLEPSDLWIPMASYPAPKWLKEPFWESKRLIIFSSFARARPGMDVPGFELRASRALRDLNRQMWPENPDTLTNVAIGSIIYSRGPGKASQEHLISTRLSGVALIVLLIAAANVINLLLARATKRRREIAVRLALGISRARLVRMITTETMLLALCGAVAALLAAWWGGALLRSLVLPDVRFTEPVVDGRVVAFTLAMAIVAGLIAGIVPGLQASKPDLTRALKDGARDGSVHRSRLQTTLVVAQAALSVTLLVGSALFIRSLHNVQGLDIGFDAKQLVFGHISFDPDREVASPLVTAGIEEIARGLKGRPDVDAVALAALTPMRGFSFTSFWFGNDSSGSIKDKFPVVSVVSRDFFSAAGLRLLRGRVFGAPGGGANEVVVNETMARQLWPNQDAIGQCMRFDGRDGRCFSVIGIVEPAPRDRIVDGAAPQFYVHLANPPEPMKGYRASVVVVHVEEDAANDVMREVAAALKRQFPTGYPSVKRMTENLEPQYRPWLVGAKLFTGFGVLALIVALVGIYSTVSYGVSQRTHEFGVRMALGARVADVLRLVVGEGVRVVAVGVLVGVALALAAGKLIAALLYGVAPYDPGVLLLVSATLLVVAALAALVPAWRAARVDPVTALRSE